MLLIFKLHSGFVKRFIKQGKLNNFWYKWRPIYTFSTLHIIGDYACE